jgi:hypothetical protein
MGLLEFIFPSSATISHAASCVRLRQGEVASTQQCYPGPVCERANMSGLAGAIFPFRFRLEQRT